MRFDSLELLKTLARDRGADVARNKVCGEVDLLCAYLRAQGGFDHVQSHDRRLSNFWALKYRIFNQKYLREQFLTYRWLLMHTKVLRLLVGVDLS